jgi:hypothetical protein|tara:strand:+ start:269 stop:640 length:372 start_codon:yes stop_codon:yes gene_type:complete
MSNLIRLFTLSAISVLFFGGCTSDDRDFSLDLFLTVEDGTVAVQNALVRIYAPVDNSSVDYYLYSDEQGKVSITLKNKAVVEIVATKNPYKTCTFAELERGVKTINLELKLFNDVDNGCRDDQ